MAGVSIATVSNTFSGKKFVNPDLARKVRQAAETLGYSVDRVASQLRSGRARVIAIIVPDLEDVFLGQLVSRLEACAQEAGYEVIVSSSRNDEAVQASRMRAVLGWRPAGIIVVPCLNTVAPDLLGEIGDVPIVGVDRIHPSTVDFDTVTIDNYRSGLQAVDYLAQQGAADVLLAIARRDLHNIQERVRGAQDAAAAKGNIVLDVVAISSDPAGGACDLSGHLRTRSLPDAIVGVTHGTTLSALSAMAELGFEAPRDLMLLAWHDSLWMTARRNPVTTLAQPVGEVARCAWDRLMARMGGDTGPGQSLVLASNLIERASTRVDSRAKATTQ